VQDFLGRINSGRILVADGAMGTMLMDRGFDAAACLESINLEQAEVLEEIARLYLDAGADIVQTNTFGASPLKLALSSLDDKTEEINRRAVRAVQRAVDDKAYISGSCGPSGRMLKPYGETEPEEIHDSFVRQMKALIEAGADIICVETMTDINEATLAVKAVRSASSSIPVMATMTFDPTPRGFFTIMGVNIETAATELEKAGADIIGSNCGNGIEKMIEIAREFKKYTRLPVIIQSNAGLPEIVDGKPYYHESPEFMADKAKVLAELGVSIIGGCCGTTPEHIAAIRNAVDLYQNQKS
jgi:5-methyltetrahydrofolate--homocysteine methyltransferase